MTEPTERFYAHPLVGYGVGFLLTVVGSNAGLTANRVLLVLAWICLALTIPRTAPIRNWSLLWRVLSSVGLSIVVALGLFWLHGALLTGSGGATQTATAPQAQTQTSTDSPATKREADTHIPTAEEIAAALAKKLPKQNTAPAPERINFVGPFPPFDLGGSLAEDDVMDSYSFMRDDNWWSIKKGRTAEIDWAQFKHAPLVADLSVRGGACDIGVQDTENKVIVANEKVEFNKEERFERVPRYPMLLEELKHIHLPIPPSTGKKSYQLVIRSDFGRVDACWLTGAITFPLVPLGGTFRAKFTSEAAQSLVGRAPGSEEAELDWSKVQEPINTVIADVVLAAWYPVYQSHERARVIIRDLTDGSAIPSDWLSVEWAGGIAGSFRPYPGPSGKRFTFALPQRTGKHRYAMDVEVSKHGMSAGARGTLALRH
jgi:hypothetical protein